MMLRIADTIEESIVDGPGIRFVVFTQGCPHHCDGCHNPSTHSFTEGRLVETDELIESMLKHPYMSGLTISGGEPFMQPIEVLDLIIKFKNIYPKKNILCYTGFTYEQLLEKNNEFINEILTKIDYLIDGKYIKELRDISLVFRGSSNQRIIDLKKTCEQQKIMIKEF